MNLPYITHARRNRQCYILACVRSLRVTVGDVLGGLAHVMLKDTQTITQTAQRGCRCGLQEEQILVQGRKRPTTGQGLDGVHQVLLLTFSLGHNLQNQEDHKPLRLCNIIIHRRNLRDMSPPRNLDMLGEGVLFRGHLIPKTK